MTSPGDIAIHVACITIFVIGSAIFAPLLLTLVEWIRALSSVRPILVTNAAALVVVTIALLNVAPIFVDSTRLLATSAPPFIKSTRIFIDVVTALIAFVRELNTCIGRRATSPADSSPYKDRLSFDPCSASVQVRWRRIFAS